MRALCGAIVVLGLLGGQAAWAKPRTNWSYGASIGRGAIAFDCGRCGDLDPMEDAISLSGHAAMMVRPELALGIDVWGVIWEGRDTRQFVDSTDHLVSNVMATVSARTWLAPRIWLQGGVGVSHYDFDQYDNGVDVGGGAQFLHPPEERGKAANWAPAAVGAIGFDFIYTPEFAVDIQFRAGAANHRDAGVEILNTGVAFGLSWF